MPQFICFNQALHLQPTTEWRRNTAARTVPRNTGRIARFHVFATLKKAGMKTMHVVQFVEESTEADTPDFRKARRLVATTLLGALMDRIRENNWESALKVFNLLREQEWYEPETGTYTRLIRMLGKCGKPELALSVFNTMWKEKCRPSVQVYTALLMAFTRSNLVDQAFRILEEMKRVPGCQPDICTYSELIRACSRNMDFQRVSLLLEEMKNVGLTPNTVTCNIILDAYGRARMFEAMEGLFTEIFEGDEHSYNYWTQNVILNSYARVGDIERMEYWFSKLQRLGFRPNVITFNILLTAYGREFQFAKMDSVLNFMSTYHYQGTTATYNTVIDAYGKAGLIKEAMQVHREMRWQGVKEDKHTFCSLIDAFGKKGQWERVEKVLRQMRNSNIEPDAAVYNAALDAYSRCDRKVEMQRVLAEMEDRKIACDDYTKIILSKVVRERKKHPKV
ncbi:hypothetical protein KP509_1Z174800 [Ceratopteris richardii]|nr:hypothetical protein KP509_1Z174800 [Ceratopteris richardii]